MYFYIFSGIDSQNRGALYKGMTDCFVKIIKSEGVYGLYKGVGANYLRLGPHTVLLLVCWDQLKILEDYFRSWQQLNEFNSYLAFKTFTIILTLPTSNNELKKAPMCDRTKIFCHFPQKPTLISCPVNIDRQLPKYAKCILGQHLQAVHVGPMYIAGLM